MWDDCRDDAFTFQLALEHLRRASPRVFYIGLGDTDEHAHAGRYDKYLRALHDTDANLKTLWDELQSRPEYRGSTTLIVTTDHGRGDPPRGWCGHGADTPGSEAIWMAVIGPDTPAAGRAHEYGPGHARPGGRDHRRLARRELRRPMSPRRPRRSAMRSRLRPKQPRRLPPSRCVELHSARAQPRLARSPSGMPSWPLAPS